MRPLRLELENFLSYREPTSLDLSNVAAAAIVGPNGAGKTSLVEAVGWCLYGKGRFRSPDDYVSVGATHARVALTFDMGGQIFRVERIRKTGAGAKSDLRFEISDGIRVDPLAGATIAETQAEIERVVGLDYETWEATSYIAQGRADAFTQLTPAGRKQLLGEVLELGRFEALGDAARAHRSVESARADALSRRVTELSEASGRREEAELAVGAASARHDRLESAVAAAELVLEGERRKLEEARSGASDSERLRGELQNLLSRKGVAEHEAQGRLEGSRRRGDALRARMEAQQATIAKLRGSVELGPALKAELAELSASLERTQQVTAETRKKAERIRADHDREVLAGEQAGRLVMEASERIEMLSRGDHSSCFTCGQDLSQELRDAVVRGLVDTEETEGQEARKHRENAAALAAELRDLVHQEQAERTSIDLGRERIAEVSRAIERTAADAEQEESERRRREELAAEIGLWEQEADRLTAGLAEVAGDFVDEEARLRGELEASSSAEHGAELAESREADARQRLEASRTELVEAAKALGAAEQLAWSLAATTQELESAQADLAQASELERLWHLLAQMFGRDGLPALVIENAVPEIEAAANRWLEKLASGRLSVRIESLRANKGGGIRETLDVIVADADAERPLEGFSGGERQRVNLALRLALSELLASRAGHRIQSLVLDEAFTALDAEGRQLAIEVIRALEETFELTLFVTHLADMGEAFPVRLEISRDETSRVEVVPA